MKLLKVYIILLCSGALHTMQAAPTITFFFRLYPQNLPEHGPTKESLDNSGQSTQHAPEKKAVAPTNPSGILVTYAGQLATSNSNGQVDFLRKQTSPSFKLLITNKVTPILSAHNTVDHWELEKGTPAQLYKIEKKYDQESKSHFWQTEHIALPQNNSMPLETILIFAEPHDIFVPEGINISDDGQNLSLPDVYLKSSLNKAEQALYVLNIKNFLEPINLEYKKNDVKYATIIEE